MAQNQQYLIISDSFGIRLEPVCCECEYALLVYFNTFHENLKYEFLLTLFSSHNQFNSQKCVFYCLELIVFVNRQLLLLLLYLLLVQILKLF